VDGTREVIAAAKRAGVSKMVHVSTPSVAHIGRSLVGEPAGPARTGRRDRAYYAESKARAELLALGAANTEFGVVAVRPHLVWGPGDQQLVGRIVERARSGRLPLIGGGRALVDTTYMDNAVDALVAALDAVAPQAPVSGRAYLVANGEPRPIRELLSGICRAAGVEPSLRSVPVGVARLAGSVLERVWPLLRDDEPPLTRFVADQLSTAHWFDLSATFTDLNWRPRITLDDGLAALAQWFASSWATDDDSRGAPTPPDAAG
jgi:nucleoside-diphosphate-sugar epimerase